MTIMIEKIEIGQKLEKYFEENISSLLASDLWTL